MGVNVQGFSTDQIKTERFLNLRYDGTDVAMMTKAPEGTSYEQVCHSELRLTQIGTQPHYWSQRSAIGAQAFEDTYKREFGFVLEGRGIAVDDVRVRAKGKVCCLRACWA